jgi:hypothetical protein
MKRTLRRLALLSVAMVLGFASCEKENNGYEYVDLGLPSGTKWATCNVGATAPHEYGNYYAWGETAPKSVYDKSNSVTYKQQMGDISGNAVYDAARANWGSRWRMPTKAEMDELVNECSWTSTTQSGVNGYKVMGSNGNSIFLPAAGLYSGESLYRIGQDGDYWTSVPDDNTISAYGLDFGDGKITVDWGNRYYGCTVRPVSD